MAAFRIATNMRIEMTEHISKLPLGVIEQFGSGKLRRTISETTGATEAYLAHQLPDKAKAIANIVGMLALLAVFDWRLGLLSLAPVLLLDVLFYIIITPAVTLTMTSLMYMSENNMIVAYAIDRVDSVLDLSELSTTDMCSIRRTVRLSLKT